MRQGAAGHCPGNGQAAAGADDIGAATPVGTFALSAAAECSGAVRGLKSVGLPAAAARLVAGPAVRGVALA